MSGQTKYRAFISYSHEDSRWARRIHRALEAYRLPGNLVGSSTAQGVVPKRLNPIFRDRDDLPAAGDLTASVRTALGQSEVLIVVCSPAAAASRWVNQEIHEFRSVNPEGKILAAIIAGDPGAVADGMAGEQACFPAALLETGTPETEAEPIGADFRPKGDGFRMGIVKLVAGMLDLRLDQIIQRDLQRRQQRVTTVTMLSLLLAIVMTGLTLLAYSARSEAERRKADAEDLIEFMLSDLQDKLEPVGRLDVLDAVGEKVVAYYAAQPTRQLSADALGRRSRAFHLLGEIESAEGDLEAAYGHFRRAYDATDQLLQTVDDDPARIFEHSQSAYWVGYYAWRQGRLDDAEGHFREYRDLAARLTAIDADNTEWLAEYAYANTNLGVVYLQSARLPEARDSFVAAGALMANLAARQPDSVQAHVDHANALAWVATAYEMTDGRDAAITARQQEISIYEDQLAAEVDDWNIRRDAINAERALARLLIAPGPDTPAADLQAALAILEATAFEADALLQRDPANGNWRLTTVRQRLWLAQARLLANDVAGAREAYLDASAYMAHPSWMADVSARIAETRLYAGLVEARIFIAMGQLDSAHLRLDHLMASLVAEANWQTEFQYGPYLYAAAANDLADLERSRGDGVTAAALRSHMVDILAPISSQLRLDAAMEFHRAQSVIATGDAAQAN
ncbi:toll/interleukin-1 receptor domain-containing protein [uncultured Maricaulis sp.]|uniref:toll/interleukin-1 receptor domain-containing protein n=1 Tax=uncultured Maricaulis sp. TaxID=174710 RepID=UPI0030DA823A|tara:strand:+ start:44820 stop:46871 length:2052 start_codon:yes stop_codon:yes gene_type:complete